APRYGPAWSAVFHEAVEFGDLGIQVETDAVVILLHRRRDFQLHAHVARGEFLRRAGGDRDTGGTTAARTARAHLALRLAEALRITQLLRHGDRGGVAREHRDLGRAEQVRALLLRERPHDGVDVKLTDHTRDVGQGIRPGAEIGRAGDLRRVVHNGQIDGLASLLDDGFARIHHPVAV